MSQRATPASSLMGGDIQGIPWDLARISRSNYRLERMRQFAAIELRTRPPAYVNSDLLMCTEERPLPLYEFNYLNRAYPCTVQHFQLRHLVWSPMVTSVFFPYGNILMEWDPITNVEHFRIDFKNLAGAHSRITAICATQELVLVGGFYGDLVVRRTRDFKADSAAPNANRNVLRLTNEDNGITNHIKPWPREEGKFVISSNDSAVRALDADCMKIETLYRADSAVNVQKLQPN